MIPLTVPEVRRLLLALAERQHPPDTPLACLELAVSTEIKLGQFRQEGTLLESESKTK